MIFLIDTLTRSEIGWGKRNFALKSGLSVDTVAVYTKKCDIVKIRHWHAYRYTTIQQYTYLCTFAFQCVFQGYWHTYNT
jgi:hypothetical protein